MKVAFTTSGDSLEAPVDIRFGRASRFLIYDTDTGDYEVIDNSQNKKAVQGAGIQASQNIARAGVKAVVTGHCGPKAFRVLEQAGVTVYQTDPVTVGEALKRFNAGTLRAADSADVEGHWM